ncbi:MAG: hypothetical protein ACK5AJ_03645 [bacterium]
MHLIQDLFWETLDKATFYGEPASSQVDGEGVTGHSEIWSPPARWHRHVSQCPPCKGFQSRRRPNETGS